MPFPLRVDHLTKTYSSGFWPFTKRQTFVAVNNISFALNKGEILGLLGPNGAGKTTTIQMLLGLLTPTSGSINYFDKNFFKNRSKSLLQVTHASGYDGLPARLTILEYLEVYSRLYNIPAHERVNRIHVLLNFFSMWDMRYRLTGSLSAGQKTRVALVKTFLPNPKIVLLDEPTAALDPDVARDVRAFILDHRQKYGTSILFTSHNMTEVTEVCDRILMLKSGAIIADDTPTRLAASVSVAHVHLTITDGLEKLKTYATTHAIPLAYEEREVTLDIDEHAIGSTLIDIVHAGIVYSHISIDRPTLEDYFLQTTLKNHTINKQKL